MPKTMDLWLRFGGRTKTGVFVLAALIGIAFGQIKYNGYQVYRINRLDEKQWQAINKIGDRLELDFWSKSLAVDILVPPEQKKEIDASLAENGISFKIFIENVQSAIDTQNPTRPPQMSMTGFGYTVYHTWPEIDQWISGFAAINWRLVTVVDVGTGKSLEGRNLRALKISTGANREAFVIGCGIHAREWVSPATCLYTAERLVRSYKKDPEVTYLMDRVDFYLIPVANPDGFDYTHKKERLWRKTRSSPKANKCPAGCYGVDPNRNFGSHWSDGGKSLLACCSVTYSGTRPFSEIETENQKNFVLDLEAAAYIDVHSYTQLWMYPWGWTYALPPAEDYELLDKIGRESIEAIGRVHGMRYLTGTIANTIYQVFGSTADFFYEQGVVCSFAAELRDLGQYGFLLPPDQIIPTGEETFEGLKTIASYIADGSCRYREPIPA